ncbi:hypothetical protein [Clostridium ihumii]|uniref:hypothetical protein n=1 Tax=Clostridium ihumii TaxID=1470356 RepID=UPI000552713B|nr:hypothetical protein [Clostridium ihumii]
MAYGRVNVGGSSGLQIEKIDIIKGTLNNNVLMDTITVPQYDKANTIFTITSRSDINFGGFNSDIMIKINPINNNSIKLERNSATENINYIIKIIRLKNFKNLFQFENKLYFGKTNTIELGKNIDINKCLIFKSSAVDEYDNKFSSMLCITEDLIKKDDGTINLILNSSGYISTVSRFVKSYYYVLELK